MGTRTLHARAKTMKEQFVHDNGPGDLAPMMLVGFDDGSTFVGHCGTEMAHALGQGVRMGDMVAASVIRLRMEHDWQPLRRMMLVVEGYMREVPEETDIPEHGQLAKDFASDPDSKVREALVTNTWAWTGDDIQFETMMTSFHYTDGGVLVWGEDSDPVIGNDGDISAKGMEVMR